MIKLYISVKDKSIVLLFEELHSIFFSDSLSNSNTVLTSFSLRNTFSVFFENNIEIHSENTSIWIIFYSKINVFLYTKAEISRFRKVSLSEFKFFDFKSFFQYFLSFITSNCHMNGNFFISLNTERSNSKSSLRSNWYLSCQIFNNFSGFSQLIA